VKELFLRVYHCTPYSNLWITYSLQSIAHVIM